MKQLFLMGALVSTPYVVGGQYAIEMTGTVDEFDAFKHDCMEIINDGESVIRFECQPMVCRDALGNWGYAHA